MIQSFFFVKLDLDLEIAINQESSACDQLWPMNT